MTGNITTLTISNAADGQTISIAFVQDATGSRTVAWPASFTWIGQTTGVVSTTANAIDILTATYSSTDSKWLVSLSNQDYSGSTGMPAGSDTYIQFNDAGTLGGDADFTWDKTNNVLTMGATSGRIRLKMDTNDGTASMFEPSTDNTVGIVHVKPRGTGASSAFRCWPSATTTSSHYTQLATAATYAVLGTAHNGAGVASNPIQFYTQESGGSLRYNAALFNNGNWRFERSAAGTLLTDPSVGFYVKHDTISFVSTQSTTPSHAIGVGRTNSAVWNDCSAVEVGYSMNLYNTNTSHGGGLASNMRYLDTTGWTYMYTAAAGYLSISGTDFTWGTAPSGSAGTAATLTNRFSVNVTSGNPRIQADFSNATAASRMSLQSSTTNGNTIFQIIPNGTGTSASFSMYGSSSLTAGTPVCQAVVNGTTDILWDSITSGGTGTGLRHSWRTTNGGATGYVMSIQPNGNVNIGATTTDPGVKLQVEGTLAVTGATIPQNSKSADYTLVAADANKHIFHPSADTTARVFTIPANASVPYTIGTALTFINQDSAGAVTIAITSDTMRLAGAGTTGSRTLGSNGVATAIKVTATEWIISGTGLT